MLTQKTDTFSILLFTFITVLVILLGDWLYIRAGYDLNFMDEGYYLNWFKNAPSYHFSVTSFGYIYRPFFLLLNENVVYLRHLNIFANFVLGLTLSFFTLRQCNHKVNLSWYILLVATSITALLILIRQDVFLATPSYNTLTFQGAIIFCIGLVLINDQKENKRILLVSSVLISAGGWLVFLGKPTSAILLVILFLIYSFLNHRKIFLSLILYTSIFSSLLILITSKLIDNNILSFFIRYEQGLELLKAYGEGYSSNLIDSFRLDIETLNITNRDIKQLSLLTVMLCITINASIRNHTRRFKLCVNFLTIIILISALLILTGYLKPMFLYHEFYMLIFLGLVFGVGLITFLNRDHIKFVNLRYAFLLVFMPYILAFGSGNSYWHLSLSTSFFWVLAVTVLLMANINFDGNSTATNFFSISIIFFTTASLWISGYFPKAKMDAFDKHIYRPFIIHNKHSIQLTEELGEYFNRLIFESKRMGFERGDPVIDMTGQYGLSIFMLNGYPIGTPMLYGGKKGSDHVAKMALNYVSCEVIAKSWILYEPRGYRKLSDQVIEKFGLSIKRDYEYSFMFRGLTDKGNRYMQSNKQLARKANKQYLLKPKKDRRKIISDCEKSRRDYPTKVKSSLNEK